jgi:hypothetical protein
MSVLDKIKSFRRRSESARDTLIEKFIDAMREHGPDSAAANDDTIIADAMSRTDAQLQAGVDNAAEITQITPGITPAEEMARLRTAAADAWTTLTRETEHWDRVRLPELRHAAHAADAASSAARDNNASIAARVRELKQVFAPPAPVLIETLNIGVGIPRPVEPLRERDDSRSMPNVAPGQARFHGDVNVGSV